MYTELYAFSEDFKEHYLVIGSANKKQPLRWITYCDIDEKAYPNIVILNSKSRGTKVLEMYLGKTNDANLYAAIKPESLKAYTRTQLLTEPVLNKLEKIFTNQSN